MCNSRASLHRILLRNKFWTGELVGLTIGVKTKKQNVKESEIRSKRYVRAHWTITKHRRWPGIEHGARSRNAYASCLWQIAQIIWFDHNVSGIEKHVLRWQQCFHYYAFSSFLNRGPRLVLLLFFCCLPLFLHLLLLLLFHHFLCIILPLPSFKLITLTIIVQTHFLESYECVMNIEYIHHCRLLLFILFWLFIIPFFARFFSLFHLDSSSVPLSGSLYWCVCACLTLVISVHQRGFINSLN